MIATQAAGGRNLGLAWRDAVTERMIAAGRYVPYDGLVESAAAALSLPTGAAERLHRAWADMRRWMDAAAIERLEVPFAFVTNCSAELANLAAARSALRPAFILSAEDAGWFKPRPEIYRIACQRIGSAPTDVL